MAHTKMIRGCLLLVGLLILGACTPTTNQLPTLVQIPTETETLPPTSSIRSLQTLPASFTPTFTPTSTPTSDPSAAASLTPTITVTPSATITDTPSPTPTDPPPLTGQERPFIALVLTAAASTALPPDFQVPNFGGPDMTLIPNATPTLAPGIPSPIPALPTSGLPIADACSILPTGGFLTLYQGNPDIANQLGCVTTPAQQIPAAWQDFENGIMVWLNGEILVFYAISDSFQSLPDTFIDGSDPETSPEVAPSGLQIPIRGFLKVWDGNDAVRNALGFATNIENGVTATVQTFNNGRMIYLPGRSDILILIGSQTGQWLSFQGAY